MNEIEREDELYLRDLVDQVQEVKNPPPKLTAALRLALESRPELFRDVFDLARQAQETMIQNIAGSLYQQDALTAQLEAMRRGMDYDQAPELVRGLIENVLTAWLRLQWVENHQANGMNERRLIQDMLFWERRHSASQRRYLQACESLARVRKLTSQTLQINIAQPGSQQVNVAGDLHP